MNRFARSRAGSRNQGRHFASRAVTPQENKLKAAHVLRLSLFMYTWNVYVGEVFQSRVECTALQEGTPLLCSQHPEPQGSGVCTTFPNLSLLPNVGRQCGRARPAGELTEPAGTWSVTTTLLGGAPLFVAVCAGFVRVSLISYGSPLSGLPVSRRPKFCETLESVQEGQAQTWEVSSKEVQWDWPVGTSFHNLA